MSGRNEKRCPLCAAVLERGNDDENRRVYLRCAACTERLKRRGPSPRRRFSHSERAECYAEREFQAKLRGSAKEQSW